MIAPAPADVAVMDSSPEVTAAVPPPPPSYRVRWTPKQRFFRALFRPLVWLQGRIYRRFLQIFAPAVAFWIAEMPIVFSLVATLVRLRIFDRLQGGPKTSAELAVECGANEDALLRLLRTAAVIGVLKRNRDGRFTLSPVGRQFLSDSPNPVSSWTELLDRMMLPGLPRMTEAIVRGKSLCETAYGKTCWEIMQSIPEATGLHDKACSGWTELVVDQVAQSYDFSQVRTVIDVGGGRGAFLSAMLKSAPHLHGRVYDRDTTKVAAGEMFARHGVADRAAHEAGNFFESVPAGADVYTIKSALHDWDDESVVKILENIRRAIPAHGKLLIIEGSVDHDLGPAPSVRAIWDVTQFATTWGKSRTLAEFSLIAQHAGFRLTDVYPTGTIDALILECAPVWDESAESAPRT